MTYDGLNSYLYDAEGRLCAVQNSVGNMTGYFYDGSGIRVARGKLTSFNCDINFNHTISRGYPTNSYDGFTPLTSWALGQGGEQLSEFSVSGSTGTWKHSNVYAGGKLLGTYDTKGLHFYLDDWLGSRRIQTNALGQLELTCQSLPYCNGENCIATALSTAEDPTEQFFTGKERDPESGDDYFGARYYSSAAGRFLSPDWSAKEEPVPYAKLDDPQSLNLYAYVLNRPTTGFDPDGHDCKDGDLGCKMNADFDKEHGTNWEGTYTANEAAAAQQSRAREFSTTNGAVGAAEGKADYGKAVDYLRKSPTMKGVVDKFENGSMPLVFISDGNDRVEGGKLYWDPHSAMETTSGGDQSPALGLGHEMTHATGNWFGVLIRSMTSDPHYDNMEERRVIEKFETPAARELGEGTRTDHRGDPFWVASPTQF